MGSEGRYWKASQKYEVKKPRKAAGRGLGLPRQGGGRVKQATRRISRCTKACCFNEYDQLFLLYSGGVTRLTRYEVTKET